LAKLRAPLGELFAQRAAFFAFDVALGRSCEDDKSVAFPRASACGTWARDRSAKQSEKEKRIVMTALSRIAARVG